MRTYPFLSNYLQSSGWELASAVLVGFNPTIPLNVGGNRAFPFAESLCEAISDLARNPVSFDGAGVRFVGACVSENG